MSPLASGRPAVLIVEDDRSLLSALTFALDAEGFDVRPYHDGQSVLAEADEAEVDCLVIDLKLPSLDGLSLLALLRERNIRAPAILITSHPNRRCVNDARAAGVEIVEKPLLDGALGHAIERAVAARPPGLSEA